MNRIATGADRRRRRAAARVAAGVLACAALLPASAAAHVSVVPKTAPAGAYTVLDVRVPNERDDAPTTSVDLQLPPGFVAASFEPVPGWQVRVVRERLSTPIETENGPISEQVSRIVWSGGEIPPGAFQDFPVSVQIPDRAGSELTFKALQTYAGGEVVRWIGAPDSDAPAAVVEIVAAEGAYRLHQSKIAVGTKEVDAASKGLAYAGLAAGVAGLLLGAAALLVALRRGRSTNQT